MFNGSTVRLGNRLFAAALLLIACAAMGQPNTPAKAVPDAQPAPGADVPKDWWSAVQKDIAQSEYNVTWQAQTAIPGLGAAWQAPNRAHDLRTYFTPEGPRVVRRTAGAGSWTWGLQLTGFGGAEAPAVQDVCTAGNRITFERDGLAEWYVNTAAGLEQGFTVYQAPASDAEMVVRMAVRGDLAANMAPDGQAVEFLSAGGVGVMRYGKLLVTDASGRALSSTMTLSNGDTIELRVDATGASFPVTVDPLATSVAWTAESNQAGAKLGWSVATAGDVNGDGYSDVIVGAPNYDKGQTDEGRVFVYLGSAAGLSAAADWTAESDQASAYFGTSVATAGDVNGGGYADVIIGAPYYDNGETNEGRVFVYHGSASGLSATANWTRDINQADAEFGGSVSSAGDVNGDGYSDVIIGAAYYDDLLKNEGRAYVYHGSSKGLSATASWTADGGLSNATLGASVAMAGDVNGDGYGDVIVGAPTYSNGQTNEGRALVYHGSSTGLVAAAAWSVQSDLAAAYLGCSVSTAGDVNGDGYTDVIVGAFGYGNGEADEGRALVYHGSSTGLAAAAWTRESDQAAAQFGWSVSTAGDVNGDGYADVIIGAGGYDNGQTDEGRVSVYFGSAKGLPNSAKWTAEGDQDGAGFGFAVATAGDVNGDGYADVIIGAPEFDNGQTGEGRAHVYYGSASALAATAAWTAEGDQVGAWFGETVSTAGDVNGDGYADVIVGASNFDNGQSEGGVVFVYHGSSTGLSTTAAWTAEGNQAAAGFGHSLSTAGDVNGDGYGDVIVGASTYSNDQTGEGRAYVYLGSASGLAATAVWTAEGNQAGAGFGSSVSTAGDVNGDGYADVIIGAPFIAPGGQAYVYLGSASGLAQGFSWMAASDQSSSYYGDAVSTAGDVNGDGYSDVVVGARRYDNGEDGEGRAFVYHGSVSGLSVSANWMAESNKADASFGGSVSTAGDVNGDGYADVIVGAYKYVDGETEEGGTFVYHGSSTGLSSTPNWTTEGGQAGAGLGYSVSTAGDVNGDGYADVIVGAAFYTNGETGEGRVFVHQGSASGLSLIANWTAESNQANAYLGYSVSTAGDVNGDGYADVIVGATAYANGQSSEGKAFVYYGNGEMGRGLSLTPRQRRGDDSAAVAAMGRAPGSDVRLAAVGRTPFGRSKVKLECEVKPLGTPFDGAGTLKTASWTSTGAGGASLSQLISGLSSRVYHWRVRLLYSPTSTPLQQQSRWFTMPWNGRQEGDFRVAAPPILGSIVINGNRSATNNPQVALALAWSGGGGTGVTLMRFSNDGSTWSAWEAAQATLAYTLPAGADGHRTVRVQYRDSVGNSSAVFLDYIRLDTIPPTGTIIINGGAATTTTQSVTLGLTWADGTGAQVSRMRFSDDGSHWTAWEPPTATRAYTLPLATLGYQTVRVQYLDGANNYSLVYNDYIKLVAP